MLTSVFAAIAPFKQILFGKHNKALLRNVKIFGIELTAFGKSGKVFWHTGKYKGEIGNRVRFPEFTLLVDKIKKGRTTSSLSGMRKMI